MFPVHTNNTRNNSSPRRFHEWVAELAFAPAMILCCRHGHDPRNCVAGVRITPGRGDARGMSACAALSSSTRGAIWMTLGSAFYACTYAAVRHLSDSFNTFEIVFFRSLLGVVFMLPWLMRAGFGALRTKRIGLYGVRVGLNYVGMVCLMYGIAELSLQDVTALMFTVPLFTVIFVASILGEKVGTLRWCALVIGFAGALVIIRPGIIELSFAAIAVVFTSASYSLVNTATKSLTVTEGPNTIVFYVFVMMTLIGIGPALYVWNSPGWWDLPWIIGLGVFSSLATQCITRSFAAADASVVMPFNFLKLPFAVVIGFIMFAEQPDLWTFTGAAIIFASSYTIARREAKARAGAGPAAQPASAPATPEG